MTDAEATVLVTHAPTAVLLDMKQDANLCVRYFTSVTPKDEGSIVFANIEGTTISGKDLRKIFEDKGVPLENHHPQVQPSFSSAVASGTDTYLYFSFLQSVSVSLNHPLSFPVTGLRQRGSGLLQSR
jgi:hypothetical protein